MVKKKVINSTLLTFILSLLISGESVVTWEHGWEQCFVLFVLFFSPEFLPSLSSQNLISFVAASPGSFPAGWGGCF